MARIFPLLALLALAACGTLPGPGAHAAEFGVARTLAVHASATYPDALVVTLDGIDDSRCKADVQCIWAGELAPRFTLRGGALGAEARTVQMGTSRGIKSQVGVYTLTLESATADTATLTVTRGTPVNPGAH